jgi:hypothetical protein
VEYGVYGAHLTTNSPFSLEQKQYRSRRFTCIRASLVLELIVVIYNNGCLNALLLRFLNFNGFNTKWAQFSCQAELGH